jgi:polysaccharide biosynthesis transport protein
MNELEGLQDERDLGNSVEAGDKVFSIRDLIRALRISRWLILACVVLGLIGASLDIRRTIPVYESIATIRIDPSLVGSLGLLDILGGQASDEQQTEIAILRSGSVATATLQNLTPGEFKTFTGMEKSSVNFEAVDREMINRQQYAISAVQQALRIKQVEGTQLMQISLRSGNAELSATLLNRLVDTYLRHNFDTRYNSVDQVKNWLSGQMETLRNNAEAAQTQLANFEEQNNFLGTTATDNTVTENLRMLSQQLGQVESERIIKEAAMRAADAGDPSILASLAPNPKISGLQAQETNLDTQDIELSSKFDSSYPPLMEIRQQKKEIKKELDDNLKLAAGKLHEEYNAAKLAEDLLRDKYQHAISDAFLLNRKQTEYAVLYGEVTTNRSLFNTLQKSLEQASVDAGLNSVNTMIVDRARPSYIPVEPKKFLLLSVGLLLGLATGIAGALLREALTDVIRNVSDIEDRIGLVSLAMVPHIALPTSAGDGGTIEGRPRPVTLGDPRSRAAEQFRALRNSILLSSIDRPHRKILVASALPGEGKSNTSVNYAIVLAQRGSRTLLIDADLRRPTLHVYFGVPNKDGLAARILEDLDHVPFIAPVPELPELHLLPAGGKLSFPAEALSSSKLHSLLETWSAQYDNIIIDTAPLLLISDTLPLATWADSVVLVARAGRTPVRAFLRAKALLLRAKVRIAGAVLNDVSDSGDEYGYNEKVYKGYYD